MIKHWQIYKNANQEAKTAVAVTRADYYTILSDKLDTRDGEGDLYRLAKSRNERRQYIEHFCYVNDKKGTLFTNRRAATDGWREYLEQISTEKFAHPPLPQSWHLIGPNGEADHDELTPLVNGTKAEEKQETYSSIPQISLSFIKR